MGFIAELQKYCGITSTGKYCDLLCNCSRTVLLNPPLTRVLPDIRPFFDNRYLTEYPVWYDGYLVEWANFFQYLFFFGGGGILYLLFCRIFGTHNPLHFKLMTFPLKHTNLSPSDLILLNWSVALIFTFLFLMGSLINGRCCYCRVHEHPEPRSRHPGQIQRGQPGKY